MTDLISREAAIALLNAQLGEEKGSAFSIGRRSGLLDAIEALTNMPSADTLATNEINALKDALAQAEGEIADLQRDLNLWMYSEQYPRY